MPYQLLELSQGITQNIKCIRKVHVMDVCPCVYCYEGHGQGMSHTLHFHGVWLFCIECCHLTASLLLAVAVFFFFMGVHENII